MNIPYTNIILGSQSPRRKQLLEGIGIPFSVKILDIDESFPCDLKAQNIPLYLCRKKADHFTINDDNTLLITADTIVWINEHVLNKPIDLFYNAIPSIYNVLFKPLVTDIKNPGMILMTIENWVLMIIILYSVISSIKKRNGLNLNLLL